MTTTGAMQQNDESAIRELVNEWLAATKEGDYKTVLSLMADDVIFMVPGREPFGKDAFAAQSKQLKDLTIEGKSDIQEIEVLGDRAWIRTHLVVKMTQPNGQTTERSGYTLSVLRKNPEGKWVIARDANLVT